MPVGWGIRRRSPSGQVLRRHPAPRYSTRRRVPVDPQGARTRPAFVKQAGGANATELQTLCERRSDDLELLLIYIDGAQFAQHHVIAAVGMDPEGRKCALGLDQGAQENAVVVKALLEDLVAHGASPDRWRLFVVHGPEALRTAIDIVLEPGSLAQRRRGHNVQT